VATPLAAQETATLFRGARVFDGERILEDHDVLVEGGRIARVGRAIEAPRGAVVIDARGKTLLPGLIDAHTHTFGDGLREALVFGVTTHLDMFGDPRLARTLREEQEAGRANDRADLYSAGTLVTAPRGHGTQFGIPIPTLTSPDSAQAFVDARIAEGSQWIKAVYDDGHVYGLSYPTLDRATLRAVIEAAHRRGKAAVVHIGDAASARTALEEGADGLVHLFTDRLPDEGFAELAASRGAFVVPTLTVLVSVTGTPGGASLVEDDRLSPYLHPTSRSGLTSAFPRNPRAPEASLAPALETVRRLHAAGVPILAGTDAPNPGTSYGAAMHRELELLVEAGLTPVEALAAATSAPARAFGLEDRGRIAPGLRADLVLVEGDPTREITATRAIAGVWKAGVRVDRDAFARQVAAALAATNRSPADLRDGLISDFESGAPATGIGSWMPSADNYAGGTSTGTVEVAEGGANGSRHALSIRGTITDAVPYAWYGAMWSPGTQPMSPVDLSMYGGFSFRARSDGRTFRVMIFSQSKGFTPLTRTFTADAEWREIAFAWSDFGIDGIDVMGVLIAGGPQPGEFEIQIDDFRLRRTGIR
jgi:imidazolonepropionase-like amidohydrolase